MAKALELGKNSEKNVTVLGILGRVRINDLQDAIGRVGIVRREMSKADAMIELGTVSIKPERAVSLVRQVND